MSEDAPVNIGAALVRPFAVHQRVLSMQIKLQRWAVTDGGRRFDDVFNLVADPCFLDAAWAQGRENRGANTAVGPRCGGSRFPRPAARSASWASRPVPIVSCRPH